MLHRPLSADAAFRAAEDTAAAIAMKATSSAASASLLVPQSGSQGGEKYRNENDMEAHISGGDKIKSQAGGLLEDDTPVLTTVSIAICTPSSRWMGTRIISPPPSCFWTVIKKTCDCAVVHLYALRCSVWVYVRVYVRIYVCVRVRVLRASAAQQQRPEELGEGRTFNGKKNVWNRKRRLSETCRRAVSTT